MSERPRVQAPTAEEIQRRFRHPIRRRVRRLVEIDHTHEHHQPVVRRHPDRQIQLLQRLRLRDAVSVAQGKAPRPASIAAAPVARTAAMQRQAKRGMHVELAGDDGCGQCEQDQDEKGENDSERHGRTPVTD